MASSLTRTLFVSFLYIFILGALPLSLAHGGSTSDGHETSSKSLILVKIYCLIIIFFAAFLGGISPCFIKWNDGLLVLGTQFGGGVFLGTALIHFLNDANVTFQSKTDKAYPFAFMLACAGYLLTMLADCVVQWVFLKQAKRLPPQVDVEIPPKGVRTIKGEGDETCKCDDDAKIIPEAKNFVKATVVSTGSITDTILLILALCFHSIFEGMAIGVAENANDAWRALWTISLHKVFAAIAMGIALLRMLPARPLRQCTIYSFLFGISSPIGVAIGLTINTTTEGAIADWIYAISMGIACGVFIYVAINHLLVKGYVPHCKVKVDTPFYKFLASSLGVGILAVVMIWD